MKTRQCDECEHSSWLTVETDDPDMFAIIRFTCWKDHKPKFYQPKNGEDKNYGYKRKCEDFIDYKYVAEMRDARNI